MFEVLKFEILYRLRRPVTYIYFVIILLMGFFATGTPIVSAGGSGGNVMENSPLLLANLMLVVMWIGLLITSAVMGVPVLRDYEHSTSSMIFSTPLGKNQYLAGRFLGSFLTIVVITSAAIWGMMLGQLLPWPWQDNADKLMPFEAWRFFHPFLILVLPNLFVFAAIFFAGGTLSKKMVVVYAQAIILFMGYQLASLFLSQMDNKNMAAFIDPFGFGALEVITQYWTVAEQNSQFIPMEDVLLQNRIIWFVVGVAALGLTFWRFSYNTVGTRKKGKEKALSNEKVVPENVNIPVVTQNFGFSASIYQIFQLSIFYFKWIIKQVPFIAIALCGLAFVGIIAFVSNTSAYDIGTYATTNSVLRIIGAFNLFFIIIIVFYSGELIWKERDVRINLIYDALPYPEYVGLIGKFIGFILVHAAILLSLIVTGIFIQLVQGYDVIELGLYFKKLFTDTYFLIILYTFLGFFIQVLVNQKFLGFALMVLFYISLLVVGELGVEHNMFYYARANLGTYSEMNSFGHFVTPFSWFNVYWTGFAMILFAVSVLFSVRGTESVLKSRLKVSSQRLTRPVLVFTFSAIVIFVSSGFYIYHNTNVLNSYENSDDRKKSQADYERTLKKYEFIVQPKIVDAKLEVDIFPHERDFTSKGYYILKNKTNEIISAIHIQKNADSDLKTTVEFEMQAELKENFEDFRYEIYELASPLKPGEEMKMNFEVIYTTNGFKEGGSNTNVVYNGTFFRNSYFPSIGYNSNFELGADDDRKDNDLEKKERMMERDDPNGLSQSLFGDDADKINFEITISTDSSQIAIAPGYLQKEWTEGDRTYYHYKMDTPMVNYYSIVSADYAIKRDVWKAPVDSLSDVNLEIYYHEGHEYNLDRMMSGLKKSLDYYTTNFSPFQFRQLRVMEFPQYSSFAQSFANTIPFSEGIGFIQNIKEGDIDLPFYVTAHEVAHQWWGHQVTEAGVKGSAMLSETMSQYSALMVMKKEYPPEQIKKFLKHELNSYLQGRTFEAKKEMPIELVEGQGYIHYRKGSLLMYAFQDYISEDSVNMALRRFNKDWAFKEGTYPTTKDLLGYFRSVTPDSLQYLIKDFFETITLFENKATEASYEEKDGKFIVDLTVDAIKYRADSLGNENSIPLADWIDIGVFGEDEKGEEKLIYLQKHKIDKQENKFSIEVDSKPFQAGIDPINKLIDRNPKDNTIKVEEKEKI